MASYIGKPISLISQSDIRYRGILHNVDPVRQTIQLANVSSMGTENRRPVSDYISPHPGTYDFILFRAPEVKDISLETTPAQPPSLANNVQNDPAVIGVSQGSGPTQRYEGYGFNGNPAMNVPPVSGQVPAPIPVQSAVPSAAPMQAPAVAPSHSLVQHSQSSQPHRRRDANGRQPSTNTIRTALQSVERAMVEAARNGKRGDEPQVGNMQSFTADFDFETSNAKFNKVALVEQSDSDSVSDAETNPSDAGENNSKKEKERKAKEPAYNPTKSFFDALTLNSLPARGGGAGGAGGQGRGGGRGGRGRGGGYGRSRREEEAQRNMMTFGEALPITQSSWGGRRGGRRGGGGGLSNIPGRGISTNSRTG